MTPILIGSEVCAETLKGASARVNTAHPSSHGRAALLVLFMSIPPIFAAEIRRGRVAGRVPRVRSPGYRNECRVTNLRNHVEQPFPRAFAPPKPRRVTWF